MFALSLSTLVLALAVAASPIKSSTSGLSKLTLARKVNEVGIRNLLQHDQARARRLKHRKNTSQATPSVVNEPVNNAAVIYIASIGVGTPPTSYDLIVDTGSSNTWVGAGKSYVKTSSSKSTGDTVTVVYGSGSFTGMEYIDTVTITPSLVIANQSIGAATASTGFTGYDGILGIGPVDLTQGTLIPDTNAEIPTVTDNAFAQKLIVANEIGVSFEPTNSLSNMNGELTWGGVDSTKFTGALSYTPITTTSPASLYWGIDESITYGTSTSIMSSTAGIVDTGTTLMLIATDAYNRYTAATGATADPITGLLTISSAQYANLKSLFFHINGVSYEFTANAQTWPRSLNTAIGGSANSIYLIVGDIGSNSGSGLDFINGYTFLERYYSVYDTANRRVGFAPTAFTFATTN
ncbi:hypothetical protein AX17_001609 [Amanita inopinata Kibby_2008]|nr:hypothetical protein AX17_001609 [Amanita inopinata Kibby_2008]